MFKSGFVTVILLAASQAALAQQAPDAGRQLQQIPTPPIPQKPAPEIRIERSVTAVDTGPIGTKIRVKSLQIAGQTVFTENELITAAGFVTGDEMSLPELRGLVSRISDYYHKRGYFLAQAYLPAQDINDGAVTIAVIEGRYGRIDLRNRTNLVDDVARGVLTGLDSGDVVATEPLERRLLLLSDIPGVAVRSTLSPGTATGTSDLIVDLDPGRRVTGSVEADNAGNRYTGAYRLGGTVYLNNPTGHGDVASLRLLASDGGLIYGRASYQSLVGVATLGVAYAHIDYELGREFDSLDADGTADIVSLYGSYPLVRSRDTNLTALAAAEWRAFEDKVGLTSTETDKEVKALTAGFSGDHRDGLGGGGATVYSLSGTFGDLDRQTPADRAADRATARSNGSYGKLQASLARLQTVSGPLSLYAAIRGQIASKNLDSSEQMSLGGAYGVRAYPEGEAYGDEGYLASLEARLALPSLSADMPGRVQLFGFVDAGAVRFAKNPWFAGSNRAERSGYGAGLSWTGDNDFIVKASYARKLGDAEATSAPDRGGRFWIQLAKIF